MCHYVSDVIPGNSGTVELVAIYSHLSLKSRVSKQKCSKMASKSDTERDSRITFHSPTGNPRIKYPPRDNQRSKTGQFLNSTRNHLTDGNIFDTEPLPQRYSV